MAEIKIKKTIVQDMITHSQEAAPIESCGYLAGKDGFITHFFPMKNVDESPEHFSFDPKEQFSVLKQARNEGITLMSVYHSHPESPARLSEEDLRLLNDPNMIYIIVSLKEKDPDVKAYKIKKDLTGSDNKETINIERVDLIYT